MDTRLAAPLAAALLVATAHRAGAEDAVQLGPRPFYLVEGMDPGPLEDRLVSCRNRRLRRTDFSIAHRGAALQFPEHSDVAYRAAARMGAGAVECDVTFTKDGALVCRHSECDLHTTTDIVARPELNAKCTVPWTGPVGPNPAPLCCTSDLTLAEYATLNAKMDASNPSAATAEGYLRGTSAWRTDLYTGRAKVMSFRESIELNRRLGVKHIPELKAATHPERLAIFGGREGYARAFIDVLRAAGVRPRDVRPQSFELRDVVQWIRDAPEFGRRAVYLDDVDPTVSPPIPRLTPDELRQLRRDGVRFLAPPMWALLSIDGSGRIVASEYARDIRAAGLDVITWTLERSDLRRGARSGGWYYQFDPEGVAVEKDADLYEALDVLAREVKVIGVFSDWPATVTYYANCMGL